jgi:hypothetical protein
LQIYLAFVEIFNVIKTTGLRRLTARPAWIVRQFAYIYYFRVGTTMVEGQSSKWRTAFANRNACFVSFNTRFSNESLYSTVEWLGCESTNSLYLR